MNNLKKGANGKDVEQLQQMLRDAGYFTYPTNTGYFGDITEKALLDFQKARGIPASGQLDSSTSNILSKDKSAQDFIKSVKGTQYEDIFTQLYQNNDPRLYTAIDSVNNPLNQGIFLGGGTVVTPEQLAKYEKQVASEVDPYYQDRAAFDQSIYNQDVTGNQQDYQQTVDDLISSLGQDTETQNNNEGTAGTWASSARQERLNSLANKYNSKFNAASNSAIQNMNKLNTNREYNYGAGSYSSNPLLKYTASLSQTGSPNLSTTSTSYNPFGINKGIMPTQQYAAKKAKTNDLIQSQYYNPFSNI